ncbi:MAG: molybdenum cofactor biosynthesis protein MoaE [Bradyrhizobium sp.]|nr:molybdenum cofactor biosynthesis protein MoaE [Bradyrhizobium sp.]
MIIVQTEPFDSAALLAAFMREAPGAGAVISFTGITRPHSAGEPVIRLELDHYPGFTEKGIAAIEDEACARFDIGAILIVHRYGSIGAREPIVFVATASEHRRAAFEAADYLMDQLKTRAPFWKKEHGPDKTRWIEPRAQDYADLARWSK